jgi:hypothetical protein
MLASPFSPQAGNGRLSVARQTLTLTTVLLALVVALAGCGKSATTSSSTAAPAASSPVAGAAAGDTAGVTCPTSNTTPFAKTKFVLHTGLAFGTFHRYIYKPFKAGGFSEGAQGRVVSFIKAGATVLFIKREIRLATEDVKANPTLCKAIAAPLSNLSDTVSGAVTKLKGGDPSGITDANSAISDITSKSSSGGAPITERTDQSAG